MTRFLLRHIHRFFGLRYRVPVDWHRVANDRLLEIERLWERVTELEDARTPRNMDRFRPPAEGVYLVWTRERVQWQVAWWNGERWMFPHSSDVVLFWMPMPANPGLRQPMMEVG